MSSRFFSSRWQGIGLNKGLRLRPNFLRQVHLPRVAKYFYIRFRGVNHGHTTIDATSIKTANVEVKSVEATNVEITNFKTNSIGVIKMKKMIFKLYLYPKKNVIQ